jgi:hypothetical protein
MNVLCIYFPVGESLPLDWSFTLHCPYVDRGTEESPYPAEVEEAVSTELSALAVKRDVRKTKQAGKTLTVVTLEAP